MAHTKTEVERKAALIAAMQSHKQERYRFDLDGEACVVTLTAETGVKVKWETSEKGSAAEAED